MGSSNSIQKNSCQSTKGSDDFIKEELDQLNKSCKLNNIPYYFSDKLRLSSLCPIFIGYGIKNANECNEQKTEPNEEENSQKNGDDSKSEKVPKFVIKTIRNETEYQKYRFQVELNIINRLSNEPNILHFIDNFDLPYKEQNCKFVVTKYYDNSDLYEFVTKNDKLTEKDKCNIIYQILQILLSLKTRKIVHNDIKLENFIMKSISPPKILLTDFDFSEIINKSSMQDRGTMPYTAPEIMRYEPHDYEADIWSLGICVYFLLFNSFPFNFDKSKLFDRSHVLSCIENNELKRPDVVVSDDAWDCVCELLQKDQTERITVENALKLNWFKNVECFDNDLFNSCDQKN